MVQQTEYLAEDCLFDHHHVFEPSLYLKATPVFQATLAVTQLTTGCWFYGPGSSCRSVIEQQMPSLLLMQKDLCCTAPSDTLLRSLGPWTPSPDPAQILHDCRMCGTYLIGYSGSDSPSTAHEGQGSRCCVMGQPLAALQTLTPKSTRVNSSIKAEARMPQKEPKTSRGPLTCIHPARASGSPSNQLTAGLRASHHDSALSSHS